MEPDKWTTEALDIRTQLTKSRRGGRGGGYSAEARARAEVFAREARAKGMRLAVIAEAVGIHPLTLTAWLSDSKRTTFAEVRVDQANPSLVLVSPTGWRVEGANYEVIRALVLGVK